MPLIESALVVLVPEAESLVKPFRDRYDPAAAAGVPAHITLLYPFKHPDEVDQGGARRPSPLLPAFCVVSIRSRVDSAISRCRLVPGPGAR